MTRVKMFWERHKERIAGFTLGATISFIAYSVGFRDGERYELLRLAKLNNPLNF